MPHVEIWHFPAELSDEAARRLDAEITTAITRAFEVDKGVVSIGLESVPVDRWNEQVYRPRIRERTDAAPLLRRPDY
ncbi:tautomerase family protein [Nocardia callitridis]|uniref:4-oxalocrotonate tautomerase domain-containing protein n=1 Tax=Nocardia callitridis TaxID=648753 RepID=A0ABP9L696_9NOCA